MSLDAFKTLPGQAAFIDSTLPVIKRLATLGVGQGWSMPVVIYKALSGHLGDGIGLDMLAQIANCSPTHFSRAFKRSAGVPPSAWLMHRRIARAKMLPRCAETPLATIALGVGFSAQPQFTTAFKRATSITPGHGGASVCRNQPPRPLSKKTAMQAADPTLAPYVLPPLTFAYDALAPAIDEATMRLHHDGHHQAYVDNVNAALKMHPAWLGRTIEDVLAHLNDVPEDIRQIVREQGGGHANHQFFWKILTPGGAPQGPSGDLAAAIDATWGSFDAFKAEFERRAAALFGSGWAFLVAHPTQGFALDILTLPNQDSLLIQGVPSPGLLACDLWEHAYYLRYNNRRADWIKAFWTIVNWPYVGERLAGVKAGRKQL